MTKKRRAQLQEALRLGQLVRFTQPFDEGFERGYVLSIGPRWFLLARLEDACRYDGFRCFRLRDVRKLDVPDPYARFASMALKIRRRRRPRRPSIDLASVAEILRTANRAFPLVTIHKQQVDPDVCWIGRVLDVDARRVRLLEIGPDAVWERQSREHRLAEITRVDVGGDYEDALYSVGGAPPKH